MSEDDLAAIQTLASRALRFQEYIMRRAWGLYYSAWAFTFTLYVAIPLLLENYYPLAPAVVYFVLYVAASLFGPLATGWIFTKARRTFDLRFAAFGKRRARAFTFKTAVIIWLLFSLILAGAYLYSESAFIAAYIGLLLFIDLFIYRALRISFSFFPLEGYVAVGTFTFSIIMTAYVLSSNSQGYLILLAWLPSIAGWLFASIYALYNAPESMVE
ncbi:MAG: hypothetical protein QXV32_06965 [Conexivisphaerales archaeon]